jgi:hypothetical protein
MRRSPSLRGSRELLAIVGVTSSPRGHARVCCRRSVSSGQFGPTLAAHTLKKVRHSPAQVEAPSDFFGGMQQRPDESRPSGLKKPSTCTCIMPGESSA